MKRWIVMLLSIAMLFGLVACATEPVDSTPETAAPETTAPETVAPETTAPVDAYDLVYDMGGYDCFSDIFEEKSLDEWAALGRYTMLLEGMDTPVVVNMDGTDVLSVSAFGQTLELGDDGLANDYHDGYSPVYYIRSTPEAVVVRVSGGEGFEDSHLITKACCHSFRPENGCETAFSVEDGALRYRRTFSVVFDFEQMEFGALENLTGRDEPLSEKGSAEIKGGEVVLTAEETVTVSDAYDLDAMFAEGKDAGYFEAYDSLDALLEANRS